MDKGRFFIISFGFCSGASPQNYGTMTLTVSGKEHCYPNLIETENQIRQIYADTKGIQVFGITILNIQELSEGDFKEYTRR